jgi:hypothetical protein
LLAALLCWHRNSFVLMLPCASKEGNLLGCIGVTILAWMVRGATEVFYFMSIQYLLDFWNALPAVAVRCQQRQRTSCSHPAGSSAADKRGSNGWPTIASNYVYTVASN